MISHLPLTPPPYIMQIVILLIITFNHISRLKHCANRHTYIQCTASTIVFFLHIPYHITVQVKDQVTGKVCKYRRYSYSFLKYIAIEDKKKPNHKWLKKLIKSKIKTPFGGCGTQTVHAQSAPTHLQAKAAV